MFKIVSMSALAVAQFLTFCAWTLTSSGRRLHTGSGHQEVIRNAPTGTATDRSNECARRQTRERKGEIP
jgi:hypothetical protein